MPTKTNQFPVTLVAVLRNGLNTGGSIYMSNCTENLPVFFPNFHHEHHKGKLILMGRQLKKLCGAFFQHGWSKGAKRLSLLNHGVDDVLITGWPRVSDDASVP